MKNQFFKLITMLYLFILTSCGAALEPPKSNTDYKNIIGKPIKIGNIEVAQYDFPETMSNSFAWKACHDLGDGWKLPNKVELNYLYQNRFAIGGFAGELYWSSTEGDNADAAWQRFNKGIVGAQGFGFRFQKYHVRAIKVF